MRILPDLEVAVMPHGLGVQIRGARHPYVVRGQGASEAWSFLASQLPNSPDLNTLIQSSPEAIRHPVSQLAALLEHHGLISETDPQLPQPAHDVLERQSLFWARQGLDPQGIPSTSPLLLIGTGLFGAVTYDLLARSGCDRVKVLAPEGDEWLQRAVQLGPEGGELIPFDQDSIADLAISSIRPTDLVITALRHPPLRLLEMINQLCLEENRIWVPGREEAGVFEVGPAIYPHRTACFTCVELRRQSRDPYAVENHVYHQARVQPGGGPQGEVLAMATLAASAIVLEVSRILQGETAQLWDTLLEMDWTLNPKRHPVLRVPRCPSCYSGRPTSVSHG